jgi:hypothetical protein
MNNSRSQTKIRRTQQVNLLAEQRYLRSKGIIMESDNDFMECFNKLGLAMDQIPQSCMSIQTKEDFLSCRNEINQFVLNSKQNLVPKLSEFFICMEGKAQNAGIFNAEMDSDDNDIKELEDKKIVAINFFTEDEDKELLERLLSAETLDEFYEILDEEDQELPDDPDEGK